MYIAMRVNVYMCTSCVYMYAHAYQIEQGIFWPCCVLSVSMRDAVQSTCARINNLKEEKQSAGTAVP